MNKSAIEKRWEKSGSHCEETVTDCGLHHYEGTFYLDGVTFPFTCNEQAAGNHLLRGQVSVYSQNRGKLMRLSEKGPDDKPVMLQKSIYPSVACKDGSLAAKEDWKLFVMGRVESAAQNLLEKNKSLIKRDTELAVTPEAITPQMALTLYGDSFLRSKHNNATSKSIEDYRRALSRFIRALPNLPMRTITARHIQTVISETRPGKQAEKLTHDFWTFCIDARYCLGSTPFPSPEKRRKSAKAKQAAADRLDILDLGMQASIYHNVLSRCSGADCGLALLLWGGFPSKYVCSLFWGDFVFREDGEILTPYFINDNAGATHNYSRILMPQARSILLQRRKELFEKYGKTRVCKMPVVSLSSNPEKAMRNDDLGKYVASLLKRLVLEHSICSKQWDLTGSTAVSICRNTYRHNLTYSCCLREDGGLVRFLSGQSLAGNVTADHYRSFTDEDGLQLQIAVLRRMAPEEPIHLDLPVDTSNPDYDVYRFAASTTRDRFSISLDLSQLGPDDMLSVLSRYGCDIHIEYTEE